MIERRRNMKTILHELYEGKLYPEERTVSKDPEYRPLNRKISDMISIWKGKLSEEDYRQLEDLLDLHSASSTMENTESFVCGFKLGALVMMEVLAGKEDVMGEG